MGNRSNFFKLVDKEEKYIEYEYQELKFYIRKPGIEIYDTGLALQKDKKISDSILDFMISNIFEKDEKGNLIKVFEPADRQNLKENKTPLHDKAMGVLMGTSEELSSEEEKKQ